MTAANNIYLPREHARAKVESYTARRDPTRVRLRSEEVRYIRYVFCEWSGDAGCSGMWQATVDRKVEFSGTGADASSAMSDMERWCDLPNDQRTGIMRCWHTLRDMGESTPRSVIVLHALYGDRPPDVLDVVDPPWDRAVAADYARIAKYAADCTSVELQHRLRMDCARQPEETVDAHKARQRAARGDRGDLFASVGAACEKLIVTATNDYRAAWRQQ